ncbi:MAG: hypothetical protein H6872_00965 [Methylobacteriaceae bacterium]|nr:hypothetical protein [Rhodoblastus sp.]MCC0003774.1 hypothetical protein [Methylobacteriaceae bacterium]
MGPAGVEPVLSHSALRAIAAAFRAAAITESLAYSKERDDRRRNAADRVSAELVNASRVAHQGAREGEAAAFACFANAALTAAKADRRAYRTAGGACENAVLSLVVYRLNPGDLWKQLTLDCAFVDSGTKIDQLVATPLWNEQVPLWVAPAWNSLRSRLPSDQNWDVWTSWYDRRLDGRHNSIPYESTWVDIPNEVWTPENGWLAANAWIAGELSNVPGAGVDLPSEAALPEQEHAASRFTITGDGLIDLVPDPPTEAGRDEIEQSEHYEEARGKLIELHELGFNLLGEIARPVGKLVDAMPVDRSQASIVRLWHRANSLRKLLDASNQAAVARRDKIDPDPDPAVLPLTVERTLRDFIDSYNIFIVGDEKGRELDRKRLGPGQRQRDEEALAIFEPVVKALQSDPGVATMAATEAIKEQMDQAKAAPASLAGDQDIALARDTSSNWLIAAVRRVRKTLIEESRVAWKGMREGAYRAAGAAVLAAGGLKLLEFVADNATNLKAFSDQALANPAIHQVIDAVVKIFSR